MKYSIYNSVLNIDERHSLLYNASSDMFVVLNPRERILLETGKPKELEKVYPKLYIQLQACKAIVPKGKNESQDLANNLRNIIEDKTRYELQVNPTVDCNFRCWYCYENHVRGSRMNEDMVERLKHHINSVISSQIGLKHFHLSFFGGEPLLYFSHVASPLIGYAKQACEHNGIHLSLHFTSNGYLIHEQMLPVFKGIQTSFQITLDGAKEHHDHTRFMQNGKGSYDRIISNIKLLTSNSIEVLLRINYTAANMQDISSICPSLANLPNEQKFLLHVNFQRVWQDSDCKFHDDEVRNCIEKQMQAFEESGFKVSYHKVMTGTPCYGDLRNYALVNYNGDVFCCTARDFTHEHRAGYLNENGQIVWENDEKNRRISLKFSREVCHKCRIAPICCGGCTQRAIERGNAPGCLFDYTERDINDMLLERFEHLFMERKVTSQPKRIS